MATSSWSRADAARAEATGSQPSSKSPGPDRRRQRGVVRDPEVTQPVGVGSGDVAARAGARAPRWPARCAPPAPRSVPRPRRAPSRAFEVLAHRFDQLGRASAARRAPPGRRWPSARGGIAGGHAEEHEEIPLALADPAPDGGQLHRAGRPAQVGRGLQGADGGPLDRGVDLPPVHPCRGRSRRRRPPRTTPSSSSREPNPPTSPPPPKRQAGAHSHPMSSAGSPAWASSQSSTPRRPSAPTRRLPKRKSPCTVTRGPGAGRCALQPARAELERGARLAQRIEQGQGIAERVGRRAARRRLGVDACGWRPGRAAHCAVRRARGPRPSRRRAGSCGGWSRPPAARPPTSRAEVVARRPGRRRAGTGTPAAPRRLEQGRAPSGSCPGCGAARPAPSGG